MGRPRGRFLALAVESMAASASQRARGGGAEGCSQLLSSASASAPVPASRPAWGAALRNGLATRAAMPAGLLRLPGALVPPPSSDGPAPPGGPGHPPRALAPPAGGPGDALRAHARPFSAGPPYTPVQKPYKQEVTERVVEVTAEDCDKAIDHLSRMRESYDRKKYTHPKSLRLKVKRGARAAWRSAVGFVSGAPGAVWRVATMSPAEWRAAAAGGWAVVKDVAGHYWVGAKLLAADVRVASRLGIKVARGKRLTRREKRQLTRTTADVFRLVPMSIFVLVPFMELLLPLALKLWPDMLPSTFQDKLKKEEEQKKRLAARLGVAQFLQDTVAEMAKDLQKARSGDTAASAEELVSFMKKVRSGQRIGNSELAKFSKLFDDELTLDNLERIHLSNMCKFLGLQSFGSDEFLRQRLRDYIRKVKKDDRMIKDEGLENLEESELRDACRARGMAAPFGPYAKEFMAQQLREWLSLSLDQAIPTSLLILSRAFMLAAPLTVKKEDRTFVVIREALGHLPEEVVEEAEAESTRLAADASASRAEKTEAMRRKLDVLRQEEEAIRWEEEEMHEREMALADSIGRQGQGQGAAAEGEGAAAAALAAASDLSEEEVRFEMTKAQRARVTRILTGLATLASGSAVSQERERFMQMVSRETENTLNDAQAAGGQMLFSGGSLQAPKAVVDKAADAVMDSVTQMLGRIEKDMDVVEARLGGTLKVLDADNDGRISRDELAAATALLKEEVDEADLELLGHMLNSQDDGQSFEVRVIRGLARLELEGEADFRAPRAPVKAASDCRQHPGL